MTQRLGPTVFSAFLLPALLVPSSGVAFAADEAATGPVAALGRIEPEHGVLVLGMPSTPQAISGSVVGKLLVKPGDDVTAGQVLAEVDSVPYLKAELEVARAELESAR